LTLQKLQIEAFGMLRELSFECHPHMNLIEGENESGKSTLLAFIRYMLYGWDEKDPLAPARLLNWQTGTAGGEMTVLSGGQPYCIKRSTVKETKSGQITYQNRLDIQNPLTGEHFEGEAGEWLLGMPREVFDRTACFSSLSGSSPADEARVRERIENLLFSGDETLSARRAIDALTRAKQTLLSQEAGGGELPLLRQERAALFARRSEAIARNRELLQKQGELLQTERELQDIERELQSLARQEEDLRYREALKGFERLHALKQQANQLAAESIQLRKTHTHAGFTPDAGYLTELAVNRRVHTDAEASCRELNAELRLLESSVVVSRDIQKNVQRTVQHGGEDQVMADAKRLHRMTRLWRMLTGGAVLLLLTFIYFASQVLPDLLRELDSQQRTVPVLLAVLFGVLCLTAVIVLGSTLLSRQSAERAFCLEYGAKNRTELQSRMKTVTEHRMKTAAHIVQIRQLRAQCTKAQTLCTQARETLAATLMRWEKNLPEEGVEAFVQEVGQEVQQYLDQIAGLREKKNRLDATAAQLREQLSGDQEQALRTKVPPERLAALEGLTPAGLHGQIAAQKERQAVLQRRQAQLQQDLRSLREQAEDPAAVSEALAEVEYRLSTRTDSYEACTLALDILLDADARLKAGISPRLAAQAGGYLAAMTDGAYPEMQLDECLLPFLPKQSERHAIDLFSQGTRDLAYLALRLALTDMVCRGETPPLLLDESFAFQDDRRAQGVVRLLAVLSREGQQSFLFTCHRRDVLLVKQTFEDFAYICLPVQNGHSAEPETAHSLST